MSADIFVRSCLCLRLHEQVCVGGNVAQVVEHRTCTSPMQVQFPSAARDFSPWVNFQCIFICVHAKDPIVHVRVQWIMETLKHPACIIGWVVHLCHSWLSPGKATRISQGRNPFGTIQFPIHTHTHTHTYTHTHTQLLKKKKKKVHSDSELTFFCSSLLKRELTWLCFQELKFEAVKYTCGINIDRTTCEVCRWKYWYISTFSGYLASLHRVRFKSAIGLPLWIDSFLLFHQG